LPEAFAPTLAPVLLSAPAVVPSTLFAVPSPAASALLAVLSVVPTTEPAVPTAALVMPLTSGETDPSADALPAGVESEAFAPTDPLVAAVAALVAVDVAVFTALVAVDVALFTLETACVAACVAVLPTAVMAGDVAMVAPMLPVTAAGIVAPMPPRPARPAAKAGVLKANVLPRSASLVHLRKVIVCSFVVSRTAPAAHHTRTTEWLVTSSGETKEFRVRIDG
jgi:hypothetical protein